MRNNVTQFPGQAYEIVSREAISYTSTFYLKLRHNFCSWEQWKQHTVMDAFRPNFLPTVIQKIQPYPGQVWLDILKQNQHTGPLQIFNGQESRPKGTHDRSSQTKN